MAGINRTYARRSRLRRPKPLRANAHVPACNVNSENTRRPTRRPSKPLEPEKESVIGQVPLQSSSQADSDNEEDQEEEDSRSEYDADDESDEESVVSEEDTTPPTSSCRPLEENDIRSLLEKHPSQVYDSRPPRGYKMLRKPRKSNHLTFAFRAGDGFSGDEARPTALIPAKRKRVEPVFTMGSLELVPPEPLGKILCDAEPDDECNPAPASTNPGISPENIEVPETLAAVPVEIEPRSPELGELAVLDRGYGSASQVLGFGFTSPVSIGLRSSPPGEDGGEGDGEWDTQRAIPASPGVQLDTELDRSDMPEIPDSVELPHRGVDQPLLSEAIDDEVVIAGTIESV